MIYPHDKYHPIAPEGFVIVGAFSVLSVIGMFLFWPVGVLFFLLELFSLYFFRNPKRALVQNDSVLLCPADGTVLEWKEVEEGRFLKQKVKRLSIFMSPFDVHVNRIPVSGRVTEVSYNKGKFFPAYAEKASLENEQNAVVIENKFGEKIMFVQIAGWLARRIVSYVKPGDEWKQGQIFGVIRFGSRMDIYMPLGYKENVKKGDKVKAGETKIASRE